MVCRGHSRWTSAFLLWRVVWIICEGDICVRVMEGDFVCLGHVIPVPFLQRAYPIPDTFGADVQSDDDCSMVAGVPRETATGASQ